MMDITTGIDLVEIDRFRNIKTEIKNRFLERVFTLHEREECSGNESSLAGRFAAKEAAAKALGCGIGEVHWQDLEVRTDSSGKPILNLHGKALELARLSGWNHWSLSISHTGDVAIASVTALIKND